MNISYKPGDRPRTVIVSSQEREFTLDPGLLQPKTDIRIEGEHKVRIPKEADLGFVTAPDCDLVIEDGVSLSSLRARSVKAEGTLYPVFGMEIAQDCEVEKNLVGERHNPYRVGGSLRAGSIDVDGHIDVDGDVEAEWIVARSLTHGGSLGCAQVHVEQLVGPADQPPCPSM